MRNLWSGEEGECFTLWNICVDANLNINLSNKPSPKENMEALLVNYLQRMRFKLFPEQQELALHKSILDARI